jgi:hypothetical protein
MYVAFKFTASAFGIGWAIPVGGVVFALTAMGLDDISSSTILLPLRTRSSPSNSRQLEVVSISSAIFMTLCLMGHT